MASTDAVKKYLVYWFQLGKKLIIANQDKSILPTKVLNGDRLSLEFEECWELISNPEIGDCYLQGTTYTIQDLLSPKWEITDCPRCEMPIPIIEVGIQDNSCVCDDLENWPNNELPPPREPISNQQQLGRIRLALSKKMDKQAEKEQNMVNNLSENQLKNDYLKELTIQQIKESKLSHNYRN